MANTPTIVRSYSDAVSAHLAQLRLEAEGIPACVVDGNQVTINPLMSIALGGVKLVVPEGDLQAAQQILESKAEVEEDACPRCGATRLTRHLAGRRSAFLTILFFGIPIGRSRAKVRCDGCGHTWRE